MKIKKIEIQNFKLFENFSIEFSDNDLIVFDGPNGFGKTSVYDAIELLITGRLRRYDDLVDDIIDHRESTKGNPLLNDVAKTGDLIIKAELLVGGKTVYLVRKGLREKLINADRMDQFELQLYEAPSFNSDEITAIADETIFLTEILGGDYKQNFKFLNYIEQEDNIYFLKRKDKDRKQAISHLFNTSSFDSRLESLDDAAKKLNTLCGTVATTGLIAQKLELNAAEANFSGDRVAVPYRKVVPWKDITWDVERPEFSETLYVEWLGKDGELQKIYEFIKNIDEFKADQKNAQIDKICSDEELLDQLVSCWNFLDRTEEFVSNVSLQHSIQDLLSSFSAGILKTVVEGNASLSSHIVEILDGAIDDVGYTSAISTIKTLTNNADVLARLLIGVKEARQSFIEKFLQYEIANGETDECPLCGHSWGDASTLKDHFDKQADQLEELVLASSSTLNSALNDFEIRFVNPLKEVLLLSLESESIDEAFVLKLKTASSQRLRLEALYKLLTELGIDVNNFLEVSIGLAPSDRIILKAYIESHKDIVLSELVNPSFDSVFLKIFNENFGNVEMLDLSSIEQKRLYLEWQYSLFASFSITTLQKKYQLEMNRFNDAKRLRTKILALKAVYTESLKRYQQSIIEDIEIIFHIYSGRISQDCQGGLGLFIAAEKSGIRFLENTQKSHDAIFTMSSGQLAALVISFTLALNKRYSKNSLLFVDDPVQTLDELNFAGLVDLLRHEFSDRQIFMSTHEDMMSSYMRYKFQRFGLKADRVNFKERQSQLQG